MHQGELLYRWAGCCTPTITAASRSWHLGIARGFLCVAILCVQVVSPVACSFVAAALPFLFLPDLPLYPVLNFALLKHPAVSVLLQEPCMPLTLAALRQPLLGSEGLFSRLLLSPSAATSAEQKRFLLLVLKRAMAVSHCLADGSVAVSSRLLQAHRIPQAVLPPPALLALSALPVLGDLSNKSSVSRSVLEALLLSTAAPACLTGCTWWSPHAAFSVTAAQAELCSVWAAKEGPTDLQSAEYIQVPLATVNAQHLLQRFGILQWLRAQVETVITSLGASPRARRGTAVFAARDSAALASQPVPPPPFPLHAASCTAERNQSLRHSHLCRVGECPRADGVWGGSKTEASNRGVTPSKWLPPMRDCTRLLWSLIAASTVAAPLPAWQAPRLCLWGSIVTSTGESNASQGARGAAGVAGNCEGGRVHENCNDSGGRPSPEQAASVERGDSETTGHFGPFWPLEIGPGSLPLLRAALKARRQLFKLKRVSEGSGKEETGAGGEPGQVRLTLGTGDGLRHAHTARHLLLDLLEGLQRLARAWFIFGEAAGVFVWAQDGFAGSMLGCTATPSWASDLLDASIACLSALWAVAACGESLGLLWEGDDVAETSDPLRRQQKLQASSCCGDILKLCAWAASLPAKTSPSRMQRGVGVVRKESTDLGNCCFSIWETVYVAICERGLGLPSNCSERAHRQVYGGHTGRSRWVHLALLQIQRLCGADNEPLQRLIAVAEGI